MEAAARGLALLPRRTSLARRLSRHGARQGAARRGACAAVGVAEADFFAAAAAAEALAALRADVGRACGRAAAREAAEAAQARSAPHAFYSDWARVALPEGHRFPMHKYELVRKALEADAAVSASMRFSPAPLAPLADVSRAHCPGYSASVLDGSVSADIMRSVGFPYTAAQARRSFASTGGTLAAAHYALSQRRAALREFGTLRPTAGAHTAGGTHHAFRDRGEGFCVFNDIAVAALMALEEYADVVRRVLVVDLDVHQGNGTSAIFADDARVTTFDVHAAKNWPWSSRSVSDYDIGMEDGTGDAEYLAMLRERLPAPFEAHAPDLVIFQVRQGWCHAQKVGSDLMQFDYGEGVDS